jgi:hypothetical protein
MLSRSLYQCLISCDTARLDAIAIQWGVEQLPARRRDIAVVLAEEMLAPRRLRAVWAALTEDEKAAVAAIQAREEAMPWPTFTRQWGTVRPMGPGRIARERPWESPISPAEGLWYWGIVHRVPFDGPTGLYETAFIPDELQALLPAPPKPGVPQATPMAKSPPIIHLATDCLLDDLCSLLAYIQNQHVRPNEEGEWSLLHETGLARRLRDPDPARLIFLRHLAGRLSWLRSDDAKRLRLDPDQTVRWLQASAAEQRSALITAWREDVSWNELWQVPTLQPDDTGSWHNNPTLARETVLQALAACEIGEWYAIDVLIAAIKTSDPDFQRPDGDYESWYIRDAATGEHLSGFASWDAVEGTLIRYLITHPLAWLGMVDLGTGYEGGPATAVRLSLGAAALLRPAEAAEELDQTPPPARLTDLVVEIAATQRYDRFQLSRIADWVRSGERYTYRLSAGSLGRAKEQGIAVQRATDYLEETTGQPLSPKLRSALGRWARAGTEVKLTHAAILRTKDPATLQRLTASPTTRPFISEVLGPTAALITTENWSRLMKALLNEGLLPEIELRQQEG